MKQDYVWIVDNYINGNKAIFREVIKDLTKTELIELVMYWYDYQPITYGEILDNLHKSLLIIES